MAVSSWNHWHDFPRATFHRTPSCLTIASPEGPALRIAAFGADVLQCWFSPSGLFEKPASYAVLDETPHGEILAEEGDTCWEASVGGLSLRLEKQRPAFSVWQDGALLFSSAGEGFSWTEEGKLSMQLRLGQDEHILGLGEDNDAYHGALDRRGTVRDMVTGQTITSGCVTADIPVTFYMSSAGYGLYVDNTHRACYDVGSTQADVLSMTFEGGEMLFYVMGGPSYQKILTAYTDITGKPSMPPLWTLGYIQSKCDYRTWDEIDDVLATMREKGFPLDCYVIDAGWMSQLVNFEFDDRWEGKTPEKIREYKEKGYKLLLSTCGPMIKKNTLLYQSGVDADIFVTDGKGNTVTCGWYGGELMDFTAPNMYRWIEPHLVKLLDMGVDAWWLDLIEPEGDPVQSVYHGGTRARIHNAFSLINTKMYYDITRAYAPSCRPFILGRTAVAGIQRYGSATWTGDVYCDWDTLKAHCPEALNTALSGIPNWTCDNGGFITSSLDESLRLPSHYYKNDKAASGALYARWWQLSCFAPVARAHHVGPCEPYAYGPQIEAICKRYIRLRYALLPYIYTYTHEAAVTGMGVMRALPYAYPQDEMGYRQKDEFLFGDSLLIAPVLEEYATSREVYFPEGVWYDLEDHYRYNGPCTATVYAPLDRLPIFVRAGAIIPTLPEMLRTDEKPWDPIIVHVYPEGESTFTSYLDDGKTTAWEKGEYTQTTFLCREERDRITLSLSESNPLFTPAKYCFAVHMKHPPKGVAGLEWHPRRRALEQAGRGWCYDEHNQVLYAMIDGPRGGQASLCIEQEERELYIAPAPRLEMTDRGLREKREGKAAVRHSYLLPPALLPGRVQLQNFDRGGEGAAYHMLTPGNEGGELRNEDVNISLCSDEGGGYQLSHITAGEWLCYTVNMEHNATCRVSLRVANSGKEASFHVYFNERDLTGKLTIPCTGGDDVWTYVHCDHIDLRQGEQVIRLLISDGTVQLNHLDITEI